VGGRIIITHSGHCASSMAQQNPQQTLTILTILTILVHRWPSARHYPRPICARSDHVIHDIHATRQNLQCGAADTNVCILCPNLLPCTGPISNADLTYAGQLVTVSHLVAHGAGRGMMTPEVGRQL